MRLSIAATAMSLVFGVLADMIGPISIPQPPAGSACLGRPDQYPKSADSDQATVIVKDQRRSLGITSRPRQWARDLLDYMGTERAAEGGCRQLQCACVASGQKAPYGVYKSVQCPLQRGASYQSCSVEQDGFQVRSIFQNQDYLGLL